MVASFLSPEGTSVSMVVRKPTTSWAVASLACGVLACLLAVALPALYSGAIHQESTGVGAGPAVAFYGLLSITLGSLGVIFGIVALRRIRSGECGGRGKARAGIVLGCLPVVVLVSIVTPRLWEALRDWIANLGRTNRMKRGPI
jgi:hypothetical protein